MDRYHFISLDRKKQLRFLKLNGRIIHRRLKREYTASIYQMENFYIEIWENQVRGQILNLVIFKDKTLLNFRHNLSGGGKQKVILQIPPI